MLNNQLAYNASQTATPYKANKNSGTTTPGLMDSPSWERKPVWGDWQTIDNQKVRQLNGMTMPGTAGGTANFYDGSNWYSRVVGVQNPVLKRATDSWTPYTNDTYTGWDDFMKTWQGSSTTPSPQSPNIPSDDMDLTALTKFLQSRTASNFSSADDYFNSSIKAAQEAREKSLDNYNTSVNGYRGMIGDLTNQSQQATSQMETGQNQAKSLLDVAMSLYNPSGQQQNIMNGTVPEETKNQLQKIYDQKMGNVSSDLDKSYNLQQRQLVDNLASRGVLNSTIASNALAQMEGEKERLLTNSANTYGAELGQNLVDAPFRIMEGSINNLGAQHGIANSLSGIASSLFQGKQSGMNSQATWGSSIPQMVGKTFDMTGQMADLPYMSRQANLEPLMQIFNSLLSRDTNLTLSAMSNENASDSDWLSGVGSIVGAIGGLF